MTLHSLWQSITKPERRFIAALALVLALLTGAPFVYAALVAPPGYFYSGISSLTPADNPVYFSYIRQVSQGNWLLFDKFTSEPQTVGLLNVFWLGVGGLARVLGLGPVLAFHLARLLLIPWFLLLAYVFGCLFFDEPRWRKQYLIWLCFASGLGVYLAVPRYVLAPHAPPHWSPPDVWVPEAVTFLTLYKTPHFISSLGGMLAIFLLMMVGGVEEEAQAARRHQPSTDGVPQTTGPAIKFFARVKHGGFWYATWAGLIGLVLFNFHPFYVPTVLGTLALTLLLLSIQRGRLCWAEAGYSVLFAAISSPAIFYHLWALKADPILAARALQNYLPAPPLIFLLFGYGLLWGLAGFGFFRLFRWHQWSLPFLLLVSWGITCLALIFLPTYFQNRYTEGLHVVLVIFSLAGLKSLAERPSPPRWFSVLRANRYLAAMAFVLLLGLSNVFVLTRDLYYFTVQPRETQPVFYLPTDLPEVVGSLKGEPAGAVLADPITSLFIPVFSDHPAFAAHSIETIDYAAKLALVNWLLGNDKHAAQKEAVLRRHDISYLLFIERPKAGSFDPATKPYLHLLAQDGDVRLFALTPEIKE